ncbi:MAG: tryptophan--tRNA ligase [Acidobacteria bacterium RIFCSPLOWO2_12_FULL_67_14]|nr:MAG: tryptophan--tRNA ligase [Acidobacteria bacterium RIFCSPLOWO2_02_FULL_67_21]OFW41308.1 MAG: tryptophan--tRNA ligase [Acidobacteria bacterium RIFCSPLOWO2_12_FULL_67_14]
MSDIPHDRAGTFEEAVRRSQALRADFVRHPQRYRMLTGDRPTGPLHIGHYFGSLRNRVELQNLGLETFIVIADYQVLTDRDSVEAVPGNVTELVLDYLAVGLDPAGGHTHIFCHSHVPALNQLLIPFLTLVGMGELDRNPTVKEEIDAAGLTTVNAAMYTYPVHQAADILFCKGNVVPVGRDQLPHLELTRKIARRFNQRFCAGRPPVFPEPEALLSNAPKILGLDGSQKMSKSRNNAVMLRAGADETAALVKKAKTDADRQITYDPERRPEVGNLLLLASLCTGEEPAAIAARIGEGGSGALKKVVTDALNDGLAPIRAKRADLARHPDIVRETLRRGIAEANDVADRTLREARAAMNMGYGLD